MSTDRVFKTILRKKEGDTITSDPNVHIYHTSVKGEIRLILKFPSDTFNIIPLKVNFNLESNCLIYKYSLYKTVFFGDRDEKLYQISKFKHSIEIFNDLIDLIIIVESPQPINDYNNWWNLDSEISIEYSIRNYSLLNQYSFNITNNNIKSFINQSPPVKPKSLQLLKVIDNIHYSTNDRDLYPLTWRKVVGLDEIKPGEKKDIIQEIITTYFTVDFRAVKANKIKFLSTNTPSYIKIEYSLDDTLFDEIVYDTPLKIESSKIYLNIDTDETPEIYNIELRDYVEGKNDIYKLIYILLKKTNLLIEETIAFNKISDFFIFDYFLTYEILY